MTYSTGGLMTSFTDPKGNSSSFSYDSDGLLTSDRNAAGGFSTLSGIRMSDSSIVTLTTALGRTTSYYTENLKNGDQRRTTTLPTGAQSARFIASGGNEQSTSAEGMFTTTVKSLDPRFYTQAPLTDTTVSTPSGLTAALTARRAVTLSDMRNPFKLARQIDTLSLNGSNYTSIFEAISKQLTFTTPMGRKSISLLDGMGRILSFTPDPAVTPVAVNYNQEGKPAQTIQGNQSYSFGYDLPGRLASLTDALGNKTQYSYDNADRVTRLTLPSGREYNFTYDLNSNLTGITMPNGAAHNLGYTVVNLGSDYTPPDNPPYNFSHNLDKEWSGTLLPSGRRIDAGYDEGGRLSVRTYPEAGVDYLYEGATYRVKKITRSPAAGGSAQELSFSYDGSLVTERSFSGVANGQFTYVYDNNFLPVQIKFVSGTDSVTTSLTRDEDGLVTASGPFSLTRSGPAGAVSRIYETYSAQLENVVVPNVAGMPRAEAEAALFGANLVLNRVYQEYSDTIPEGSVISQDPAAGATVSPGSPVNLTVCTYILSRARQTGRLPLLAMAGEAIPVLANSVTIVPDVTGMDRQFAEAAILAANLALGGDTTEYSDTIPAGNVISQDPVAGSPATEGSPVYLVVSSGPGRYVPDVVGMTQAEASQYILQENLVPGAIKAIVSNTVPIGNVISTYPSAGTGVLPGTRVSLLISGNAGFDVNINHDSLGRVSGRSHTVNGHNIYSIQLAYDSRGNISGKTETVSGLQTTWAYTYDADGQLTGAKKNGADAEIFVYDINGNRTSYEQAGEWKVLADYDRQDRLTRMGGAIYQFNADGQLTQRGPDAFLYSATGELLQATVAGQTITYSYDGMGRRVAKTDGAGTWQYLYGDLNNPFQLTAMRDPAGTLSYYYYDGNGLLLAFDKGATRYYVATDQVGTPKVVTDTSGTVVKLMEYDSFGRAVFDSNQAFELPVGFAGGINDAKTGLVRFGYRDYEPITGRWTAKDPIFFAGGQGNLFGYVQNNPVNWVDPKGLAVDMNMFAPSVQRNSANNFTGYEGSISIGGHGSSNSMTDENNNKVTPPGLAESIRNNIPDLYLKDIVLLLSCETGKGSNPFAQKLANELCKIVCAPTEYVWYYPSGHVFTAANGPGPGYKPDLFKPGKWRCFRPTKNW